MSIHEQNYMNAFRQHGGKISKIGRMTKYEIAHDTVPAILQIGEIIIPRRIAKSERFIKDLKKYSYNAKTGKFNSK